VGHSRGARIFGIAVSVKGERFWRPGVAGHGLKTFRNQAQESKCRR
jgi:hypothetical protein